MLLRLWRKFWSAPMPYDGWRETPSEMARIKWLRGGR